MMYLNKNEQNVIEHFLAIESKYEDEMLTLKWSDGSQVMAIYDSFIEDENDYEPEDEEYEEFWSFVFKKINSMGNPPIEVSDDGYFLVNYHNFPNEIWSDNKTV